MPRPAYIAAHRPAGPAPTMMTSYSRFPLFVMEFQSRRIALPRQGSRQLRAEMNRLEFDIGPLRTGESLQSRGSNDYCAMAIPTAAMQPSCSRLNQALQD